MKCAEVKQQCIVMHLYSNIHLQLKKIVYHFNGLGSIAGCFVTARLLFNPLTTRNDQKNKFSLHF